jgi:hypothetical protein
MTQFDLNVRETKQTSGWGDYIVIYSANVTLLDEGDEVDVLLLDTFPTQAPAEAVEIFRLAIHRGMVRALETRAVGAQVQVRKFAFHPTDSKAARIEDVTYRAMLAALSKSE